MGGGDGVDVGMVVKGWWWFRAAATTVVEVVGLHGGGEKVR